LLIVLAHFYRGLARRFKKAKHQFAEGRRLGLNLAKPNKPSRMQLKPNKMGNSAQKQKPPDDRQAFMFRRAAKLPVSRGFAHSPDQLKKIHYFMRHLL
jgi:hypothetical protein